MPARTLVLMRHAKAEAFAASDQERPLAPAGRRQAVAAGESLAAAGLQPDAALVSSAVRTRQTWELLASRLGRAPLPEVRDDLYDATARTALDVLRTVDDAVVTLLVVGHEPVMSSLSLLLAAGGDRREGPGDVELAGDLGQVRLGIPTATRCVLTLDGDWSDLAPGGAVLRSLDRTPTD